MILKVQQVVGEAWKDLVEIPEAWRLDTKKHHVSRGTICKMRANGRSKYVVVVGLKGAGAEEVIGMDLNLREAFRVDIGSKCDVRLYPATWLGKLLFGWSASDPAYRIPAQVSIIALALGTILGLLGVILGAMPLYEEIHGPIFKHQSSESSVTPAPDSQAPAKDKPEHH